MVNMFIADTSCSRGVMATTINRATGVIMAPPKPCRIRAATSCASELDNPQHSEPTR
jgi:hypothetical protein